MTDGIVFVDVDYRREVTVAAWLVAEHWQAPIPLAEGIVCGGQALPYEPGNLYKRELPFILQALSACPGRFDTIVVDGYVWLGERELGLGARLYSALDRRYPIVGIAKNPYSGSPPAIPILRGGCARPLFISTIGCELAGMAENVRRMYGPYRNPDLTKRVDRLCRNAS